MENKVGKRSANRFPHHLILGGLALGAYSYDGLGRRVQSVETTETLYAYFGTETLSELFSSGTINDYLYADGMRVGRVSGSTVVYYHADLLGSTRLETSSSGTVLFMDSYQPYGQENGTPTGTDTYKYTGKPVSQTTGLYYEFARWYDPSVGRFISPDPKKGHVSNPQTLNPYLYATNQPTGITDPSGMDGCGIFSVFCNAAGTVYNEAISFGNGVVNEWNNDADFRMAVILTVATIAIVATAGIAAPALLPAIAAGIGIGAGTSVASYAASTVASGRSITASGLFKSASMGAFFGAATFGTFSAVASVAASAGLGSLASAAVGLVASVGVGSSLDHFLGGDSSSGISQLTDGFANSASSRLQTMSQGQGYTPACRAGIEYGVGAVAAGGVLMSLGAHSFDITDEIGPRARLVSWAVIGTGFALVAGGLAYSIYQCG